MLMKRGARIVFLTGLIIVIGAITFSYTPSRAAQPVAAKAESDELRALYATPSDVADGKRLAQSSCASCHGLNGISNSKGSPNLAGQRPAYLHLELRAYQSGARGNAAMQGVVKFLSDDALYKVAAYYGSLDPAQPEGGGKTVVVKDPVQVGKAASAGCAGCHGEGGVSKTAGIPSLVGLDPKYLVAAMKAYKSTHRKNDMMRTMLSAITESDMNNLALYYALQKPAPAQAPATGDKAAGKAAAAACAGCHGEQGISANPTTPSLAGQDAQYLVAALQSYKNASRGDETMKGIATPLDERAMKNIAAFYAGLQPQAPKGVTKPLSVAEWAQRCDRCHGINGNSSDPRLPALASQRSEYLANVLHAYQKGERKNASMAAMSEVLSDTDIENLAAHYARQKARSFVYVIPGK